MPKAEDGHRIQSSAYFFLRFPSFFYPFFFFLTIYMARQALFWLQQLFPECSLCPLQQIQVGNGIIKKHTKGLYGKLLNSAKQRLISTNWIKNKVMPSKEHVFL